MSAFDTPWFNSQDRTFFAHLHKSNTAHVILAAETEDFDAETTKQWQDEGFHVTYVPLLQGGADFIKRVRALGDSTGVSEQYAIVAFDVAASLVLEAHTKPNTPKLCAIVAYYPTYIPPATTNFPAAVQVLVHLAGDEVGVRKTPEVLGIQAKRKTVTKRVDAGKGYGECLDLAYKAYTYSTAESGFAEQDLEEYDPVAASVAFTRSLATIKHGFRIFDAGDIEEARDRHVANTTNPGAADEQALRKATREYARVIHAPTLTGGVGSTNIASFYAKYFRPLPPSLTTRLLSRTIGTDRVVDELSVSLKHSQAVPWLLPGIPATNKPIEIIVVSIFRVCGGRLESEHVYWDQASVLLQVGLLDAKVVPEGLRKRGVKTLPVVGAEGARAVRRGSSRQMNGLLPRSAGRK